MEKLKINLDKGYVDIPVSEGTDLKQEIVRMKQDKNAIILAHYYQPREIQDIADYRGDSLALAQWASKTDADIIVLCGVYFMGETAKILCPDKKVIIPDLRAGCSLADGCKASDFKNFIEKNPGHTVVSYVNTSAAVKALTDIVVTSANAIKVVESFPKDTPIIFAPDKNLGNYINSVTGRNMLLWDGSCHVHDKFSLKKILDLKKAYPDAILLAHPECKNYILKLADFVGSTSAMIKYATESDHTEFIVATESGIFSELQKKNPDKLFVPAPAEDSTCACNECSYMKLTTLEKLYNCLKYEMPEVNVDEKIRRDAVKPIRRMLDLS